MPRRHLVVRTDRHNKEFILRERKAGRLRQGRGYDPSQDLSRHALLEYSADCSSDAGRLDVRNGLLLAPHLDAAFARRFVTVEGNAAVIVSADLPAAPETLVLDGPLHMRAPHDGNRPGLPWHRERLFKHGGRHG